MKYTINELANSKGVSPLVREALLQMADYKQLYEQVCEQYDVLAKELEATNRQVEILSDALAESRREVAAPVQEPVAWMAESKAGNVRFTNIGKSADDLESYGWAVTPLYAAPFQFQPLTEEAVLECWKQVYEPGRREHDNATRMARAIEAAHGITAAPEKGNT
jgi:hypothetical protein